MTADKTPEEQKQTAVHEDRPLSAFECRIFEGATDDQIEKIRSCSDRIFRLDTRKKGLLGRLSEAMAPIAHFDIGNELKKIERERHRGRTYDFLVSRLNRNEKLKSLVETVLKAVPSFENVHSRDLLKMEREERGTLGKIFAFKEIRDEKGNVSEIPLEADKIAEGDTVRIDFGRNSSADAKIGAGHLLPSSLEIVKIVDRDQNVRIGRRGIVAGRVGYYDQNGKYLPIFSGFQIRVPTALELSMPEYKKFGLSKAFNDDKAIIEKRHAEEDKALESYGKTLEASEKTDRISELIGKLRLEADSSSSGLSYGIRLKKTLEIAQGKLDSPSPEYPVEDLKAAIDRLKKTVEILGDKDFGIDLDRYKTAIARHESGGMGYFARNDESGRSRGVNSEKWAFGKYQFTVETLRGYGIDLGNPPEESKIQAFLNNPLKQEEVMDRYVIGTVEKHVLTNPKVMKDVESGENTMAYFLALTHIGGPGKLKGAGGRDWLGTDVHAYAAGVSNAYERGLSTDYAAQTKRASRTEAWADTMDREKFIASAEGHLGKKYKLGANGDQAIDCSQLVVEAMKENGVAHSLYDNTAEGFFNLSNLKNPASVKRGDLVFLRRGDRISHVEIALWGVETRADGTKVIPIIDASSNAGKVTKRYQVVGQNVSVGTPPFLA